MSDQINLDLIKSFNELKRIENKMKLIEELVEIRMGISASKIQEVLVQCSFNNDKFLNALAFKEKELEDYAELYRSRNSYQNYILEEKARLKLSEPAFCIAFMKEYQKKTWKQIADYMNYSIKQCQRYYFEEYLEKNSKSSEDVSQCRTHI